MMPMAMSSQIPSWSKTRGWLIFSAETDPWRMPGNQHIAYFPHWLENSSLVIIWTTPAVHPRTKRSFPLSTSGLRTDEPSYEKAGAAHH